MTQIFLPRTEKEFDQLVAKVCKKFKLKDQDHAAVVVANRIMHLPPDQATTTVDYLGHCILKNIAYQIAQLKGSQIAHKAQVDQLVSQLKADPNDGQARDELFKASQTSEYAKEQIYAFEESISGVV